MPPAKITSGPCSANCSVYTTLRAYLFRLSRSTPGVGFSAAPGARSRLPPDLQGQPGKTASPDPQPVPGKTQDPFFGNGSRDQPSPRHHLESGRQSDPLAHLLGLDWHRNGAGMRATLRTAAMDLLRLAGFQSIRAGMQAVMHDITTLLKMAKRKPQHGPG